jgi:hypothetical protein
MNKPQNPEAAETVQTTSVPAVDLPQLVSHLIYGDIEEMPLSVLGDECPDAEYYNALDREQQIRLAAAATVKACLDGMLHPSGFLLANSPVQPPPVG